MVSPYGLTVQLTDHIVSQNQSDHLQKSIMISSQQLKWDGECPFPSNGYTSTSYRGGKGNEGGASAFLKMYIQIIS